MPIFLSQHLFVCVLFTKTFHQGKSNISLIENLVSPDLNTLLVQPLFQLKCFQKAIKKFGAKFPVYFRVTFSLPTFSTYRQFQKYSNLDLGWDKLMCGKFGEVTGIIGLIINVLAFRTPLLSFHKCMDGWIGSPGGVS